MEHICHLNVCYVLSFQCMAHFSERGVDVKGCYHCELSFVRPDSYKFISLLCYKVPAPDQSLDGDDSSGGHFFVPESP